MTFKVETIQNGLKVYSKVNDKQQLIITDLELEDPDLLSRNSIEIEIRKKVSKEFECEPHLEIDDDTERKLYRKVLNNIRAFESE